MERATRMVVGVLAAAGLAAVCVASATAATRVFSDRSAFTPPDGGAVMSRAISVSDLAGPITQATASIDGPRFTTAPSDVDAVLVAPSAKSVMLMSDACAATPFGLTVRLAFDDLAAGPLPYDSDCLSTATYRPTNYAGGDANGMPPPAPAGPYGTTMATFNGSTANGVWTLYIRDDESNGITSNFRGWSLSLTAAASQCNGREATIEGTPGNDTLTGNSKQIDVIAGLAGKDTIRGLSGGDLICGGAGKDTLKGGKGRDTLLGQQGADVLQGGDANDACKGGKGRDTEASC